MPDNSGGPDLAALNSMQQSQESQASTHSGSSLPEGGDKLGGNMDNDGPFKKVSGEVDFGLNGANLDHLSSYGSALGGNPFNDIADGTLVGPGNVSHGGTEFATSAFGDVSLGNMGFQKQFNANMPKIHSGGAQQGG